MKSTVNQWFGRRYRWKVIDDRSFYIHTISHRIHIWYIFHILVDLYSFHVGKYTNQSHGNPDHGILMDQSGFQRKWHVWINQDLKLNFSSDLQPGLPSWKACKFKRFFGWMEFSQSGPMELMGPRKELQWWPLRDVFLCLPRKLGKMNPIWRAYFSDGLVQHQPVGLLRYKWWLTS